MNLQESHKDKNLKDLIENDMTQDQNYNDNRPLQVLQDEKRVKEIKFTKSEKLSIKI